MATAYKVGDLVKLKSGGPTMTIRSMSDKSMTEKLSRELLGDENTVQCQWFSGSKLQSGWFNPQTLEPISGDNN